jgi:anti-sigma regulatory factor (Ser/Thr protein kinase)
MAEQLRHRLPHGPQAPARARRALEVLRGILAPDALNELRLLVSELVTNAVRHGRPVRAGDGVELLVRIRGGTARVEVVDGGRGFVPPGTPPDLATLGGWGLVVVDRIADRWGVDGGARTRVWLEFDLHGARGAGNPGLLAAAPSV